MKKLCLILIVSILIISLFNAFSESENFAEKKINKEILKEAKGDGKIPVIVRMKEEFKEERGFKINNFFKDDVEKINKKAKRKFTSSNSFSVDLTEKEINKISKDSRIEYIEYDYPIKLLLQDAIELVNSSSSWNKQVLGINLTGIGQSVCVIDSGINYSHPDLGGCSSESFLNGSCSKVIAGYDFGNDDENPMDYNGHGTHVAGIVSANGEIKGIAPEAKLIAIKVYTDDGIGSYTNMISGIDWCVDNSSIYNISVITISSGLANASKDPLLRMNYCDSEFPELRESINNAVAKNITVTIATGNTLLGNVTAIGVPACIENATPIASSTKTNLVSSFSNRNSLVQLFAPGSNINSTNVSGTYTIKSGTSMATPVVAGAVAILNQYLQLTSQFKTPQEIESIFNQTGNLIDDSLESGLNYSIIDIFSALFSIDNQFPDVTLITPENNEISVNPNQNFICNVTDDLRLSNITFYLWNSSNDLINQSTLTIQETFNQSTFNIYNLSIDTYHWNCEAYDQKGNSAFASSNFTLTITNLNVILDSPVNNFYTSNNQIEFNCTAESTSGGRLMNATFYIWNSSNDLINQSFLNISGNANLSIFEFNFSEEGIYYWNCKVYDNLTQSTYADSNYTLIYDKTIPNITIISPADSSSYTSNSQKIDFIYNITETNIANCSLIINGEISITNSSINTNITQIFTQTFTPESYIWSINCTDFANNKANSSSRSFTVNAPIIQTTGSSSGGSSGGVSSNTYNPSTEEITKGYTKLIKENDRVKFRFFDKNSEEHLLILNKIEEYYINLTIKSEPINFLLAVGQSRKLNLTSADFYDFYVKLESINLNRANITIQIINEPIINPSIGTGKVIENNNESVKDNENEFEDEINFLNLEIQKLKTIVFVIFIILFLLIIVSIKKNKIKKRKETKNKKNESTKTKPQRK